MQYSFAPMDEASARSIVTWQYEPPYSFYNVEPDYAGESVAGFLDPAWAYFSIRDQNSELVGFCCFGEDARVPGGDYGEPALDVGWGMRPDLTGQGRGATFVRAILEFGKRAYAPEQVRTTVAEFNVRSRRTCERAGFVHRQWFTHAATGDRFAILTRPA